MTPSHTISRLDDPRVAGYRNLRERSLRDEGLFITEGALLAERLLQSHFSIESLLVTPQSEAHFAEKMPPGVPLYVAEAALLREVVGFDFHRGVLGLGRRPTFPGAVELVEAGISGTSGQKFIVCPGTETGENLGLILRSARAFGVAGVLLPTGGADPLSRRCLRQSMGSALSLPLARSDDLLGEMRHLRRVRGLRLVAAVAGEGAGVIPLADFSWPQCTALVVGNEYDGLDAEWLDACDDLITIPVAPGCDSLNVAVATGVLLHHMSSTSGMLND